MRDPSLLLLEILARRVPPTAQPWQTRVEDLTGIRHGQAPGAVPVKTPTAFDSDGFLAAFTAAARWLGKAPLLLEQRERNELWTAGVSWSLDGWHLDELARVSMITLIAARLPPAELDPLLGACYRQGDSRERQALLRALPFLPAGARFVALAIDACRTNELPIFEAIACENPYPAACFPSLNFNQMILKAMFLGVALARVVGLEPRRSSELARMARDYASERQAAGRSVPADIGLLAFDPEELRATRIPD